MTLSEIAQHRLVNQQLLQAKSKTAVDLLQHFGAIQAQEYAQSKWAFGLRLPHLSSTDVEKDFVSGKLLRTHLLRPTWHFVAAKDIRWMLMLTAPRVHAVNAFMYRKLALDAKLFVRCNKIISKALSGKQLTRDAINLALKKNKIVADGHRLSYIMMQAELDGLICSGAKKGNQFTYALLEERVPAVKAKSREEALAELTKRFFTSRGPATVKDFSTWSGLTLSDCKNGIEMLKPAFSKEKVGKEEYFYPSATLPGKKKSKTIHLLPIYDEYIMGYKDRSAIQLLHEKHQSAPAISFLNLILLDGQVAGSWKRTLNAKGIDFDYQFFEKPDRAGQKLFEKAVERYGEFHGLPVNFE
jgi:hypothetical protein